MFSFPSIHALLKSIKACLRIFYFLVCCATFVGCVSVQPARDEQPRHQLTQLLQSADAAYAQGQWAKAKHAYLKITSQWASDHHGFFRLGNCQLKLGELEGAKLAYKSALALSPGHAKSYNNLSVIYLMEAQDLLHLLEQNLRPSDVSARQQVQERLQHLDELLSTSILGLGNNR